MASSSAAILILSCFLALSMVRASVPGSDLPRIRASGIGQGGWLRDNTGRIRIFHGINAVQKGFPWYPPFMQNETRLGLLEEWGFNAVRLGMMWSGGEPSEGVFNDTYYSITTGIINDLAAHGMHSLLDMHQDCASSEFCLYDGLPRWLIDKRRRATHAFPWPFNATDPPCQRFWEDNCLTEDAGVAYQSLYDNVNGMADAMAAFWRESASRFRDLTSVLGYELINEPFAGDVYADPLLFLPALAGKQNLLPLYDNVTRAIRAVDDETLVFYEPVTWGMFLSGEVIGSGFSRVPLSAAEAERSVLSYHYYCPTFPANQSAPYPPFNRFLCDELMGPSVFKSVAKDIGQTGGASMLTEFGSLEECETTGAAEAQWILAATDEALQSYTFWDPASGTHFFDGSGNVLACRVKVFARPYVRAFAGEPLSVEFNATTDQSFRACWTSNTSVAAPTELFVPRSVQYPAGAVVTTTPNARVAATAGNVYSIVPAPSAPTGEAACVSVAHPSPRDALQLGDEPVGVGGRRVVSAPVPMSV